MDYEVCRLKDTGDFQWAMKTLSLPEYRYRKRKSHKELKDQVLQSKKIKEMFNGDDGKRIEAQVKEIVNEMGHAFHEYSIRGFGYFVRKLVLRQIFENIFVNKGGMDRIRAIIPKAPVLFLPSHRSYVDFLLVSYLCYTYDVPMPAIAAGYDFLQMAIINRVLRHCGAFYIHRTINPSQQPYFNVFVEYAQCLLKNGDMPMEFFIEGTRSRTGKSLHPKLGLFRAVCDVYFSGQVPDIYICPMSITYEQPMEESLHLWEILGVPKPKESTTGLWKARKIMQEKHGRIFFYASEPVLLSDLVGSKVDRKQHALKPKEQFSSSESEIKCVKKISYDLIVKQQRHMVMYPSVLVATILLQNLNREVSKEFLADQFLILKQVLELRNADVLWEGSSLACVERGLAFLSDSVVDDETKRRTAVNFPFPQSSGKAILREMPSPRECSLLRQNEIDAIIAAAVNIIRLDCHKNQLLHFIGWDAILCVVLLANGRSMSHCQLKMDALFLARILSEEMVFRREDEEKLFESSLSRLTEEGVCCRYGCLTHLEDSGVEIGTFLSLIIKPALLATWLVCVWYLDRQSTREMTIKEIAGQVQSYVLQLMHQGHVLYPQILSLELIKNVNAGLSLSDGPFSINKRRKAVTVTDKQELFSIHQKLGILLSCSCPSVESRTIRPKL
eukprot:m.27784 g.27784  ORF g.27784 m.27784 type:complete len:671 (+) comp30346_c0_seq1:153-2165(+)